MKNPNSQKFRILWKGQVTGPFSREQVEAKLKSNEIGIWAEISEGEGGWQPISGWRDRPKPKAPPAPVSPPATGAAPRAAVPAQPIPPSNRSVEPLGPASPRLVLNQQQRSMHDSDELPPLPPFEATPTGDSDVTSSAAYYYSKDHDSEQLPSDGGFFFWAFMPFRKFGTFSGRARRKEYWLFTLFYIIVSCCLYFIDGELGIGAEYGGLFSGIFDLFVFIPGLAVSVRRLHDTNRSGWWTLLIFTGIGALVILLFSVQEGTAGDNEYGADSKNDS